MRAFVACWMALGVGLVGDRAIAQDLVLADHDSVLLDGSSGVSSLLATEFSSATMTGGTLSGIFASPQYGILKCTAAVTDDAFFDIQGGFIDGDVLVQDRGRCTVGGTALVSGLAGRGATQLLLRGQTEVYRYGAIEGASLSVTDDAVVLEAALWDSSTAMMSGGWIQDASILGDSHFTMTDGRLGILHDDLGFSPDVTLEGGELDRMILGKGEVRLAGATFRTPIFPTSNPEIAIRPTPNDLAIEARRFWVDGVPIDLDVGSELVLDATSDYFQPWHANGYFHAINNVQIEYPDGTMMTFDIQLTLGGDRYTSSLGTVTFRAVPAPGVGMVLVVSGPAWAARRRGRSVIARQTHDREIAGWRGSRGWCCL